MLVKLRDGFKNDSVTIRVNGREIYRQTGVTTNLTISFADKVETPNEGSVARLEVVVDGGPSAATEIRVQETPFVDVWISDGRMDLRASAEEMPML